MGRFLRIAIGEVLLWSTEAALEARPMGKWLAWQDECYAEAERIRLESLCSGSPQSYPEHAVPRQ
jgi:hypothetical protein